MLNIRRQEPEDFLHPTNVLPVCQMAPVCAENRFPLPYCEQNIKRTNGHQSPTWSTISSKLVCFFSPQSCHLHFIFCRWTKTIGCLLAQSKLVGALKSHQKLSYQWSFLNRWRNIWSHSGCWIHWQTTNITVAAASLMCLHLKAEAFELDAGPAWMG